MEPNSQQYYVSIIKGNIYILKRINLKLFKRKILNTKK